MLSLTLGIGANAAIFSRIDAVLWKMLPVAAVAARSMTTLLYGFRPEYVPTAIAVSLILLQGQLSPVLFPRVVRRASIP